VLALRPASRPVGAPVVPVVPVVPPAVQIVPTRRPTTRQRHQVL